MISFVNVAVPRATFSLRAAVARGLVEVDGPGSLTTFEALFSTDKMYAHAMYNAYLDEHQLTGLRNSDAINDFTRTRFLPGLLISSDPPQGRIHFHIDGNCLTIEMGSGSILQDANIRESDWIVRTDMATMSVWMRSYMPLNGGPSQPVRRLATGEAVSVRGGGAPGDLQDEHDCMDKSGPCVFNTRDPGCWLDLCWFLNEAPTPDPGCSYESCGSDNCGWDACGADACAGAACGVDACGGAACGADGCATAACGADACGGNACGVDGGPGGVCPAAACPANVG